MYESGYGITIDQVGANETVDAERERIHYENLSTDEQRVFREIVAAETVQIYGNETVLQGLAEKVISDRGERYRTSAVFVSDCMPMWPVIQGLGAAGVVGGASIAGLAVGWRRLRTRIR